MKRKLSRSAMLLAAVLTAAALAACGHNSTAYAPTASPTSAPARSEAVEETPAPTPEPTEAPTPEPTQAPEPEPSATPKRSLTRRERLEERKRQAEERLKEQQGQTSPEASPRATPGATPKAAPTATPEAPKPLDSIEAIAAVGGLEATVQQDEKDCVVFIFDEERNHGNPYDVTWDYGDEYNAYLDKVDWSLVFDAGYYRSAFPLLALQYHDDDALLLRHFQTVGIHEGRQGCKSFNVAAYMDNCGEDLRTAFGDSYECYYLYYLMHQDTESQVQTTGDYKGQLAQELTVIQKDEIKWTNYYREEVDAGTVEFDAEMAAFANYRAYMDCTEGWDAHEGLEHIQDTRQMNALFFDRAHSELYCENKNTIGGSKDSILRRPHAAYSDYRASPGHYETMVDPDYGYVGCGNWFVSDQDYNWAGKYDVNCITLDTYADTVRNPFHNG